MLKATAVAHPIQGLVKYHGLVDPLRRIPYHGSISVATAPTRTVTTVEPLEDVDVDRVVVDGRQQSGRALERSVLVLDQVRAMAGMNVRFRVESENDFPAKVGLGSSSSGFAALARAACASLELPLELGEVSEAARVGAGSACRSVTGGVSEWITRGSRSFGRSLAQPGDLDWGTVAVLSDREVPTEGVHEDVKTSPFFRARVEYVKGVLDEARLAVRNKNPVRLMALAELDTLNLHAVTMTGGSGLVAWTGQTVEVMHRVRRLRLEEGVEAFFSVDTGATVYVNFRERDRGPVRDALVEVADASALLDLTMGGPSELVDAHLF